uniref:SDE2 telomere maintenance homolog (S. pombe) n=1 Tax=Maylandia zebra TaxID=106582 RepID=A0A3P9BVG5_9CICH
ISCRGFRGCEDDRRVHLSEFSCFQDFYVTRDGRRAHLDDPLEHGAVYHLELRLLGGKGGFGSMLRALGAQIEKTTNREACRDLSGRRLRDVNHEKEMADWLKKQAEREAEKEQRRLERLQRKLNEPKHQFTDAEYQQQCHDLSERLEDSVLRGWPRCTARMVRARGCTCLMPGVFPVAGLQASSSSQSLLSSSNSGSTRTTQIPKETSRDQTGTPSEDRDSEKTSRDQTGTPSEDRDSEKTSRDQTGTPSEDQNHPGPSKPSQSSDCVLYLFLLYSNFCLITFALSTSCCDKTNFPHVGLIKVILSYLVVLQQLDLLSVASVEQLESLGLDVLKKELMSRGLKCGGTPSERAARLFAIRGLSADEIDPLLLAKPTKPKKKK